MEKTGNSVIEHRWEVTIKTRIAPEELPGIINGIKKIQKEHKGDCILSVRIPDENPSWIEPPL